MPSKAVVLVVASFLLVSALYSSSIFDAFAREKATKVDCTPVARVDGKYYQTCCWQGTWPLGFPDVTVQMCISCEKNVGAAYWTCGEVYRGSGLSLGLPTSAGNALPPPGNNTGPTIKVPPGVLNALPNVTNALPPGNNTGTVIKVPPGGFKPIGNLTNAPPTTNSTGTPPPTLLKSSPSTTLAGQQPQTQQTTGHHHHKGKNQGSSTSNGNSTGH